MRQAVFVVLMVAAAFLGGAAVNGPGVRWIQVRLLEYLGVKEGEIASVDLPGALPETADRPRSRGVIDGRADGEPSVPHAPGSTRRESRSERVRRRPRPCRGSLPGPVSVKSGAARDPGGTVDRGAAIGGSTQRGEHARLAPRPQGRGSSRATRRTRRGESLEEGRFRVPILAPGIRFDSGPGVQADPPDRDRLRGRGPGRRGGRAESDGRRVVEVRDGRDRPARTPPGGPARGSRTRPDAADGPPPAPLDPTVAPAILASLSPSASPRSPDRDRARSESIPLELAPSSAGPPPSAGIGPAAPVSPGADPAGWTTLRRKLQAMGVTRYRIEGEPGGRVVFWCLIPLAGRQAVSQRFEAEGDDEFQAAQAAIRRIALWRATRQ